MLLGKDVCKTAREVINYPYVLGGNSIESGGFDSLGLVQYAYKQVGIEIPRTSYEQFNMGKKIYKKEDLIEGDLIFNFDKNGVTNHVMLYCGNGRVVESKYTGTFVTENSNWIWQGKAIRILNEKTSEKEEDIKDINNDKGDIMYRVIVGSYRNRDNANEQQEILTHYGITSFIAVYGGKEKIYRVVAGSFKDRSKAEERQKYLTSKGFITFLLAYEE